MACRQLGLDEDTRRGLQKQACGKNSMRDMTEEDLLRVVETLKEKGFKPKQTGNRRPKAARADVRYIHVLWRLLADHGAVHTPGRQGLNAFIQKRFAKTWGAAVIDVDALREHGYIKDVIEALKDWCHREGIELDG